METVSQPCLGKSQLLYSLSGTTEKRLDVLGTPNGHVITPDLEGSQFAEIGPS